MHAPPLTRRRALALGAAGGLSSLLTRATPPAWGASAAAAPRGFGLDVARDAFGPRGRTGLLRAPRRFDLLGVRGAGGAGLEVRVRRRGRAWSPWVPIGPGHDHRPDTGTGEHASDPVWAGGADELELRATRRPDAALRVHFVAVPAVAKRLGARASVKARAAARAQSAQGGPPPIIPRSQWGGDSVKPRSAPEYGDVQAAFVHHTVSANDYAPEDSAGIVLAMAKYHRDTNGWNDLGYNFVVDKYGQIFEGRAGGIDQAIVGAQAQGYNSHSTGVANIGTYSDVAQTPAALDAMAKLIAWKLPLHGAPVTGEVVLVSEGGDLNRYKAGTPVTVNRICGHRDGDATECPGNALYGQLPDLRNRTAAIAPAVVAAPAATVVLDQPATAIAYGSTLDVSGTVRRPDGTPVAGQSVSIQKRGSSGWVTVARAATNDTGAWTAGVAWRATGQVRARVAVPGSPVTVTPPVSVDCLPALSASARTTRVRAGRTVTVNGSVRPASNVTVVIEKQGSDGRYRRVGQVVAKPKGSRFDANVTLARTGLYRLTPRAGSGKATANAAALYVRAVSRRASLQSPSPSSVAGGAGTGTTGAGGSGGVAASA